LAPFALGVVAAFDLCVVCDVVAGQNAGVLRRWLRMTAKDKQGQKQKQIPCGNDNKKSKSKSNSNRKAEATEKPKQKLYGSGSRCGGCFMLVQRFVVGRRDTDTLK
jgi:hypothetical protein